MIPTDSDGQNSDSENEMMVTERPRKQPKQDSQTEGQSSQSDSEARPPKQMKKTKKPSQNAEARPKQVKKTKKVASKSSKPNKNSDSESDLEIRSQLSKKPPKLAKSNTHEELLIEREREKKIKDPKKFTTKEMIHEALQDLKSRKGVSYFAIKKYMTEKHGIDTSKIGYHIKKYIKSGVESGILIQVKGMGVSGSFKLAPVVKKKPERKVKVAKEGVKNKEKSDEKVKPKLKSKSEDSSKIKKMTKEKSQKNMAKPSKSAFAPLPKEKKAKRQDGDIKKKQMKKPEAEDEKKPIAKKSKKETKMVSSKMEKEIKKTKRKSMMRRKSIGSLVKAPKMKPK